MTGNHYEICIIPLGKKAEANIAANKQDSGKTSKTFTVQLWPEKADVTKVAATHLWYCWWMSDEKSIELKKDFDGTSETLGTKYESRVFDLSEGWTPERVLEKVGLKTIAPVLEASSLLGPRR